MDFGFCPCSRQTFESGRSDEQTPLLSPKPSGKVLQRDGATYAFQTTSLWCYIESTNLCSQDSLGTVTVIHRWGWWYPIASASRKMLEPICTNHKELGFSSLLRREPRLKNNESITTLQGELPQNHVPNRRGGFLAKEFPDCSFMLRPSSVSLDKQEALAESPTDSQRPVFNADLYPGNGKSGYRTRTDDFRRGNWKTDTEIPSLKLT